MSEGEFSPPIGAVRFHVQLPHADLDNYRLLHTLLLRPHIQLRRYFVVGLLIGVPIGLLAILAAGYWQLWAEGALELGLGRKGPSILLEDASFWGAAAALFIAGAILARVDTLIVYRMLTRRMCAASLRTVPRTTLLIGDNGLHMTANGVVWTIPWSAVSRFYTGNTASFITYNGNLLGIILPHEAFATADDRAACLSFLQSRAPKA